ncbi:MAG: DUF488 family protein [Bryobacteraceae bacterium]|nr:DUF488 family protein [Bryobacteraceae bacterium]
MFSKQRAILRLLENEGGSATRLRLVKLAFLLSREARAPKTGVYDFVPYRRGPFSFTLYHDLRGLENGGWVVEAEHEIRTSRDPEVETALLDRAFRETIDGVSRKCRKLSTSDLIADVYTQHPWFTLNSDAMEKRAVTKPIAVPSVYTVGYEGITVDGLLDLLLRTRIDRLIDVRCNPIARRYGFHKSTLNRLCQDVKIEYVHVPSLGVPSAWRADLDSPASYQRLFKRYETEVLPSQATSIARVAALVADRATALMCMEADHNCCHRSRLAAAVSRETSLPVKELR